MVESDLKKKIKEYIESRGGFWSLVQGGPYSKPGDPDLIMCYKSRHVGLEAKTFSGRPSAIQKRRKRELEMAGGIYIFPRSLNDVARVMDFIDEEEIELKRYDIESEEKGQEGQ